MWKPSDIIVFVLSATVSIVLLVTVVDIAVSDRKLSKNGLQVINNIITFMIAIVSIYIGSELQKRINKKDDDEDSFF